MTFHSCLPVLALVALSAIGCAAPNDEDASSAEANQTSSSWKVSEFARRPNIDVVDVEGLSLAVDASGHRHAVYLGNDRKTHYVDLTSKQDVALEGDNASGGKLALDAQGQPHVAYYSSKGTTYATRKNGQWAARVVGIDGYFDQIAVDSGGTVHIATNAYAADGTNTASISTLKPNATAFEHAQIPGLLAGETGFDVNALAVDKSGTEYALLHSTKWVQDSPRSSHSEGSHSYWAKRSAGGAFSVEVMDASLTASAGSIAFDAAGSIHAIFSTAVSDRDTVAPVYVRRGANDTAWSAPEKLHWDGYRSALALDAAGNVHVAFTGNRSGYFAYVKRTSAGWGAVEYVSTSDANLPSVALDSSGKPVLAFRTGSGYDIAERIAP